MAMGRDTCERPWGELSGRGVESTLEILGLLPWIFWTLWFPVDALTNPDDWRNVSNALSSFISNCHWIYTLTRVFYSEISLEIMGFYFTFGSLLWREPSHEPSSAQHMIATVNGQMLNGLELPSVGPEPYASHMAGANIPSLPTLPPFPSSSVSISPHRTWRSCGVALFSPPLSLGFLWRHQRAMQRKLPWKDKCK